MAEGPGMYMFQDSAGSWRWRLLAANNEKVAASEAYASKSNAKRGAETVIALCRDARIHIHDH